MHGGQSESTDGPKDHWNCVFCLEPLHWLQWSLHSQLLDVGWCSAAVVVVLVVVLVVVVVNVVGCSCTVV